MSEQFGKPKIPEAKTQTTLESTEETPNIEALVDLLQKAMETTGKYSKIIARELSDKLGVEIKESLVYSWVARGNPSFPTDEKLEAIASVFPLPLDEIIKAKKRGLAGKLLEKKLSKARNISKQKVKVFREYDVFGEGSSRRTT